jgi:hypothetical protein
LISITGNSLRELEQQLDELKRQASQAPAQSPATNESLRTKIIELKRRATRTTGLVWKLVLAVAARQTPCTLDELAQDLNLPQAASVHSLLAILGRPCSPKRLNLTVIKNLGGNPTRYTMPPDVRAIVIDLGE